MDVVQDIKHTPPPIKSISFCPASHAAEPFETGAGLTVPSGEDPRLALLRTVAPQQHKLCSELLYTSLPGPKALDAFQDVLPKRNGFVHTVVEAYNRHRALIVRPDDVWLAILTQFSFFVNGNAEALRSTFVAHEGKRNLIIKEIGNRHCMDPVRMARRMTVLMQEHIVDPLLREWIMPSFTTTTMLDRSISAIVMMGTMQEYFAYTFMPICGIPRVTIEGEKSDWEDILRRLERLKKYDIQTIAWYHLLRPIISRIIAAYDNPNSPANLNFWNNVAHWTTCGSGPMWLSGSLRFACSTRRENGWVDSGKIPCGYTYVDVKLVDNDVEFDTVFVAGLVGSQICSVEETESSQNGPRNTVRPLSAWWYFIKAEDEDEDEELLAGKK